MDTNKSEFRTIHTGLFTKRAKDAFASVVGQLSDGKWENSSWAERFWRFIDVDRTAYGEVILKVSTKSYTSAGYTDRYGRSTWYDNGFRDMTDVEVLRWMASKMLAVARDEGRSEKIKITRQSVGEDLSWLSRTEGVEIYGSDVIYLRDFIFNEVKGKYADGVEERVVGKKLSDERATEIEYLVASRKSLIDARDGEIKSATDEINNQINALKEQIKLLETKKANKRQEMFAKYKTEIEDLSRKIEAA